MRITSWVEFRHPGVSVDPLVVVHDSDPDRAEGELRRACYAYLLQETGDRARVFWVDVRMPGATHTNTGAGRRIIAHVHHLTRFVRDEDCPRCGWPETYAAVDENHLGGYGATRTQPGQDQQVVALGCTGGCSWLAPGDGFGAIRSWLGVAR